MKPRHYRLPARHRAARLGLDVLRHVLERAAAAQPDDADLLDSVGQMYEAIGDCAVASPYYTRALEINPEVESSREGLARCG